jgi:flagellar hook-basal body complex protein FliE
VNVPALEPIVSSGESLYAPAAVNRSPAFGDVLAAAVDDATSALVRADTLASGVAAGTGNVIAASVARAKADLLLEILAVGASRVSGALNALLQTQV